MLSTKRHKLHLEQSLLHWRKKFGELLFKNKKVIDADVDLPKFKFGTISGNFKL